MAIAIKKRVTLKDLGRQLGLSERAVSQALSDNHNATSKVSEKTREKVVHLARKLGYRRDIAAKSLSTGRTGLIGVITTRNILQLVQQQNRAVVEAFARHGQMPLSHEVSETAEDYEQACNMMLDAKVDGVLLVRPSYQAFMPRVLNRLLRDGVAVTAIGHPHLRHVPKFIANKKEGFYQLARHLIDEGYRSIMLQADSMESRRAAGGSLWHVGSAVEGFTKAAREVEGQPGAPELIYHRVGPKMSHLSAGDIHPLYVKGYAVMRGLIAKGKLPDAIMCQVDTWALGVLRACAEAGVRVPEDVALTGFEGDPTCSVGSVPLTSVMQPFEQLADLAVERLMAIIKGECPQKESITELPCTLTVRQSSVRRKLPPPEIVPLAT